MEGRTSFIIAHRLSTIRDADLILYEGRRYCRDRQTRRAACQGRLHAELYQNQFADVNDEAV